MLTHSFVRMLGYSIAIGAASGSVGMVLSYHLNVQSGPTIVLVGATAFGAVFVVTGRKGLRHLEDVGGQEAPAPFITNGTAGARTGRGEPAA